jgi:hypothetical protein
VAWARRRRPARMRATYRRPHGVEHFLGFYDVHGDYLNGIFQPRRGVAEVSEAFRQSAPVLSPETLVRCPRQSPQRSRPSEVSGATEKAAHSPCLDSLWLANNLSAGNDLTL